MTFTGSPASAGAEETERRNVVQPTSLSMPAAFTATTDLLGSMHLLPISNDNERFTADLCSSLYQKGGVVDGIQITVF
jgi:hypothetical protein